MQGGMRAVTRPLVSAATERAPGFWERTARLAPGTAGPASAPTIPVTRESRFPRAATSPAWPRSARLKSAAAQIGGTTGASSTHGSIAQTCARRAAAVTGRAGLRKRAPRAKRTAVAARAGAGTGGAASSSRARHAQTTVGFASRCAEITRAPTTKAARHVQTTAAPVSPSAVTGCATNSKGVRRARRTAETVPINAAMASAQRMSCASPARTTADRALGLVVMASA